MRTSAEVFSFLRVPLTGALTGRDGQQEENGPQCVYGGRKESLTQPSTGLYNQGGVGLGRFAVTPMTCRDCYRDPGL